MCTQEKTADVTSLQWLYTQAELKKSKEMNTTTFVATLKLAAMDFPQPNFVPRSWSLFQKILFAAAEVPTPLCRHVCKDCGAVFDNDDPRAACNEADRTCACGTDRFE